MSIIHEIKAIWNHIIFRINYGKMDFKNDPLRSFLKLYKNGCLNIRLQCEFHLKSLSYLCVIDWLVLSKLDVLNCSNPTTLKYIAILCTEEESKNIQSSFQEAKKLLNLTV